MREKKRYAKRDHMALDKAGGYYIRHVSAMTGEELHWKSAIAGELGYRDMLIDELCVELENLIMGADAMGWGTSKAKAVLAKARGEA